jgi:hypothetical protein
MELGTLVALLSAGLAAIVAVYVPVMTFRLALRQDHARWLREQRAQLYIELLAEAHAEQQYFEYETAADETQERMRRDFVDLRLPPIERARLGARATIAASGTVNARFNRLQHEVCSVRQTWLRRNGANSMFVREEFDRQMARTRVNRLMKELHTAIRNEMGSDAISLEGTATPDTTGSDRLMAREQVAELWTGLRRELRIRHLATRRDSNALPRR